MTFTPELQRISEQARPYPWNLLPENGTGLCLFAAAFLGWNDAIHMARKQMRVTCVDVDENRLEEMHDLYPADWSFRVMDAWEFAETTPVSYDAVSVDTFTGQAETRSLHSLELWCGLATQLVTVTCSRGRRLTGLIPDGWKPNLYERSSEVNWLVLTHG